MDFSLFKAIIDEAQHYGARSFSLHLFGEPLLYPKFFESVEYIKKKNKRNTVLITSNGTMFDRFVDDIVKSKIDKLIWSWRPEAKFSSETKEKMRRWGKMTVRIINEVVPKEAKQEWKSWKKLELRSVHNYGGNVDITKFGAENMVGKRYPCYHLWLAPAVSWNGNFLMCCSDPHQKEVFGNINNDTIHDCWKRLDGVRESHMKGEFSGICKECDVWKAYPSLF